MDDGKIHSEPSDVETAAGEVMVSGPDGVGVSLTPDAAVETGARLIDAGADAHGKEMIDKQRRRRSDGAMDRDEGTAT